MPNKEAPKNNNLNETLAHENRKRLALKITVGVVAVILIFLWAFAARNRFVNFAKTDTTSAQIINNVQEQWDDAVQVIDAGATDQAKAKEQVRETLTNIIIAAASSTKEDAGNATATTSAVEQ
jgi:hypothetical protein